MELATGVRRRERAAAAVVPAAAEATGSSARLDYLRLAALGASLALLGIALGRFEQPNAHHAALLALPPSGDVKIYDGGLAAGWQDWSWAKRDMASREVMWHDRPTLRIDPAGYQGVYLHTEPLYTRGYSALWLWVHGGAAGGQRINVCAVDSNKKFLPAVDLGKCASAGRIPAGRWNLAIVPLRRLTAADTKITGFVIQDAAGTRQPSLYLANIVLKGGPTRPAAPLTVQVDTTRDVKPISPLIYGLAGGSATMLKDLRIASLRWGGNPNTRYNWERGNCWNAARDWEFRNGNYGNTKPEDRVASGVADKFVANARSATAAALITIPTIGWVARDDNNDNRSVGVPKGGGLPISPGSDAIAGYDPAANRRATSIRSFPRKRGPFGYPPDPKDEAVYQDEWVAHLVKKFGKAADGGVRFYAMDNEPDLWASTHTDIRPVWPGYDDLLSTFLEYATAVKSVDSTAQITGPVSWGWTGYFHSPRDQGRWNDRPDRKAHGDMPFIPWFLEQVRKHDQRTGRRTLDVLDIHFYPQGAGVYAGKTDPATNALRLRSTRGLWDPAYKDESWIGEPVSLIPRMRSWIDQSYPGTKLGITEWNWGADNTMAGALAVAECLGIFGREGVYLANYWTAPAESSPGSLAFKMFRNADGQGRGMGDRSTFAASSDPDRVSCFSSVDSATGLPGILLINKQPDQAADVTVAIRSVKPLGPASMWRVDEASPKSIAQQGTVEFRGANGGTAALRLPAYSLTLLRFAPHQ